MQVFVAPAAPEQRLDIPVDAFYRTLRPDIERCLRKGGHVGKGMALLLQIEEVSIGGEK
ncbi:MAG: hypothetical protein ACRD18_05120 [Terriglobia bacterium]